MPSINILFFLVSFIVSGNTASAGHGFGNGGDPLALTFVVKGTEICNFLESNPDIGPFIDRQKFALALSETNIGMTTEQLFDDYGNAVSARYVPADLDRGRVRSIQINKSDWVDQLLRPRVEFTYRFVLHEYLWAMGIDDTNYSVSAAVDLSKLVHEFENPAPDFPAESPSRYWDAELKIPLPRSPGLVCASFFDQLHRALRNIPNIKVDSTRCWVEENHLIYIARYESKARYLFRYHFAGAYESREDCLMDEQNQSEIIRQHLAMEPLSYSCRRRLGANSERWEALIVVLKRDR